MDAEACTEYRCPHCDSERLVCAGPSHWFEKGGYNQVIHYHCLDCRHSFSLEFRDLGKEAVHA